MIILDHSIQIGAAKILVIYGIPLSGLDFTPALTYTDLTPLSIKVQEKWKWEDVRKEILQLKKEIGHTCVCGSRSRESSKKNTGKCLDTSYP